MIQHPPHRPRRASSGFAMYAFLRAAPQKSLTRNRPSCWNPALREIDLSLRKHSICPRIKVHIYEVAPSTVLGRGRMGGSSSPWLFYEKFKIPCCHPPRSSPAWIAHDSLGHVGLGPFTAADDRTFSARTPCVPCAWHDLWGGINPGVRKSGIGQYACEFAGKQRLSGVAMNTEAACLCPRSF